MSEADKRRHRRVETNQPVWVEGQDVRVAAAALNMSKGGMFVVAKESAPAIGTTLQIKFDDPREGQIEVNMQVVWREAGGAGAKLGLQALDAGSMESLARVVSHYETAQLRPSELPTDRPKSPAAEVDEG